MCPIQYLFFVLHRRATYKGALHSLLVPRVVHVVSSRFERLLGARFDPLLKAIQAELTQDGMHLGGRGPKCTVAKGPHLLRLTRSVTYRERNNPDHSSTFDRLWELYEAEGEEAEVTTVMDGATQENALASSLLRQERGLDLTRSVNIPSSDCEEGREETSRCVDQKSTATIVSIASSEEGRCVSKGLSGDRQRVITPFAAEGLPVATSPGDEGGERYEKDEEGENGEEGWASAGGSGTCSKGGLEGEVSRMRGHTRWRWKKSLIDLLKRIGGLDKV